MKNKKWLWITLTTLLTLIVLIGVAGAGFRMGMMQNVNLARNANRGSAQFPSFGNMRGFENNFNNQPGGDLRMMQGFGNYGNPRMMQGFGRDGFYHERGWFGFPHLFGFLPLVVLGLLLWGGYALYQKGGWKFVKVSALEAEPAEVKTAAKKNK